MQTLGHLENAFGSKPNEKGYRILNGVRVIQGDGVNRRAIRNILATMKASAILRAGKWMDVFKDPITDQG